MFARLFPLITLLTLALLPIGCYPPPQPQPTAPVTAPSVAPVVLTPPAVKAQEAAQAIQAAGKDADIKAKEVALSAYERLVEATRQNKVTQANYSKAQKSYDSVVSALHAYSVLSPLGGRPAEDARIAVAKTLAEFLALIQQLKAL